jgi:hypothetical protein
VEARGEVEDEDIRARHLGAVSARRRGRGSVAREAEALNPLDEGAVARLEAERRREGSAPARAAQRGRLERDARGAGRHGHVDLRAARRRVRARRAAGAGCRAGGAPRRARRARRERELDDGALAEEAAEDAEIRPRAEDATRAASRARRRDEERERVDFLRLARRAELLRGGGVGLVRADPDLEEVDGLRAPALLAVADARPRRRELDRAAGEELVVADGVAVAERAAEDEGEDLLRPVPVRREARAGRDAVLVQHAERTEVLEARVLVVREAEGVEGLQPAVVGGAALARRAALEAPAAAAAPAHASRGGLRLRRGLRLGRLRCDRRESCAARRKGRGGSGRREERRGGARAARERRRFFFTSLRRLVST